MSQPSISFFLRIFTRIGREKTFGVSSTIGMVGGASTPKPLTMLELDIGISIVESFGHNELQIVIFFKRIQTSTQ